LLKKRLEVAEQKAEVLRVTLEKVARLRAALVELEGLLYSEYFRADTEAVFRSTIQRVTARTRLIIDDLL